MRLVKLNKKEDMKYAEVMFLEYANSLPFKLDFQDFQKELKNLPGKYSEPYGMILVAFKGQTPVGCIALRKLEDNICEMKRLYVKSDYRGIGVGRQLAKKAIEAAVNKGYDIMKLDTLVSMKSAVNLYKGLGFEQCEAYIYNPLEDALYMELRLG